MSSQSERSGTAPYEARTGTSAVGEGKKPSTERVPLLRAVGGGEIVVAPVIAMEEEGAFVNVAGPREGEQLR